MYGWLFWFAKMNQTNCLIINIMLNSFDSNTFHYLLL